jgi:hypothetical protein
MTELVGIYADLPLGAVAASVVAVAASVVAVAERLGATGAPRLREPCSDPRFDGPGHRPLQRRQRSRQTRTILVPTRSTFVRCLSQADVGGVSRPILDRHESIYHAGTCIPGSALSDADLPEGLR